MSVKLEQERPARIEATVRSVTIRQGARPLAQTGFAGQVIMVVGLVATDAAHLTRLIAQALEALCLDVDRLVVEYMHERYNGQYWDHYDRFVNGDDAVKMEYISPALLGQLARVGSGLVIVGGFPQSRLQAEEILPVLGKQPIVIDLISKWEPNSTQLDLRRYLNRETAYLAIEPTDMADARLRALQFLNQFTLLPTGLLSD